MCGCAVFLRPADATSEGQTDERWPRNDLPLGTRSRAAGRPPASIYQHRASSRILSQLLAGGKSNKQKDKWRARKGGEKRGKTAGLVPPGSSISPTDASGTGKCTFRTERWRILGCRKPTCPLFHNQRAHRLHTSNLCLRHPSSTSDYLSVFNFWPAFCPLLPPSTHSFFKPVLLSAPPSSGPSSPCSFLRGYAAVMNGTCGIFGFETCYYAIFSHLGLFSLAAVLLG